MSRRADFDDERSGPGTGAYVGSQVFVLDRVRIEVALEARSRYKYVQPRVEREGAGWRIVSPNCSRNVDPTGGEIPIAWLLPNPQALPGFAPDLAPTGWLLHARDHAHQRWVLKFHAATLPEALERLLRDENREFWL